jgi:hypothetical protein
LHLFTKKSYNPQKNPDELNLENEEDRELIPLFLSNDQGTLCPERHEKVRSEVIHHVTAELFPQGHDSVPSITEMCHQSQ